MKYQNGQVMSIGAARLHTFVGTRGPNSAKPRAETEYVRKLKERMEVRIKQNGDTLGH